MIENVSNIISFAVDKFSDRSSEFEYKKWKMSMKRWETQEAGKTIDYESMMVAYSLGTTPSHAIATQVFLEQIE